MGMDRNRFRPTLIPYSIIEAAVRGEPDAVRMVLRCYSGYIAALSKRTIRDKRGFSQLQMDIDRDYPRVCVNLLSGVE